MRDDDCEGTEAIVKHRIYERGSLCEIDSVHEEGHGDSSAEVQRDLINMEEGEAFRILVQYWIENYKTWPLYLY